MTIANPEGHAFYTLADTIGFVEALYVWATLEALYADVLRLDAEGQERWRAEIKRAVAAERAIHVGRTTPPTDAEILRSAPKLTDLTPTAKADWRDIVLITIEEMQRWDFARQQAITRGSNALYGTGRTGSLGPELAKYTEGYANQAFDTRLNQLTALSGQQQTYDTNLMKELLTASGADQGNPYGAADPGSE